VTVDGTDFRIYEPTPWSSKWWSHKFGCAGLRYEIAVCIQTGWIVFTNGPFQCGPCLDLKIFKSQLEGMLLDWEMVEADEGYRGHNKIRRRYEEGVSVVQFVAKGRARARHENVNGLFKEFAVLRERFHHNIDKHGRVFRAIAVIVQISLKYETPVMQVHYPAPGNFY
jgi:hypothetical protein